MTSRPIAVGDEVTVYRAFGAYAAEMVVPASSVAPATMCWEQAGGPDWAGATARHALEAVGLREGEAVLCDSSRPCW
ncbi:hypothetical protein [Micromonospora sp. IBSANI012]|uniref:hypothetical protein n=1 Tax=Micromonospora sp. IBSANI012 TaxID=3457761 RepID=UPI00405A3466